MAKKPARVKTRAGRRREQKLLFCYQTMDIRCCTVGGAAVDFSRPEHSCIRLVRGESTQGQTSDTSYRGEAG